MKQQGGIYLESLKEKYTFRPRIWINIKKSGIILALLSLWIVFFLTNENFRRVENYLSILREASFIGIAAIGMTFCITIGALDLSIGTMLSLIALVTVSIVGKLGLIPTIFIIVILGAACGTINGLLCSKIGLPTFITTLAMSYIYRAISLIFSKGNSIQFKEKWFTGIGNGSVFLIPIPFIIFALLAVVGTLILRKTIIGREILSVSNSEKVSYLSGIDITKVRVMVFILVGIFTAISAFLISSRLWCANVDMKSSYEFDVIAVVVLAGRNLQKGKSSMLNIIISAIFYASIFTGLNMFQIDSYMQKLVLGIILLFGFAMNGTR